MIKNVSNKQKIWFECMVKHFYSINHKYNYDDPSLNDGEFKLLLHDYIKGQIRENHSIEKIGYIVGF